MERKSQEMRLLGSSELETMNDRNITNLTKVPE